jgi:16S rRNA (uracil1498-N3)-methyltransferase
MYQLRHPLIFMYRFFLKTKIEDPQSIVIADKEIIHKITKVLRLKVGDSFVLFDTDAAEYEVVLKEINKAKAVCGFIRKSYTSRDLEIEINLHQSLLKADKFEWLCQKVTEIGVKKIIPVVSENCVVKELNQNKVKRCQKIIEEATIQSGGKISPVFGSLVKFEEAIKSLNPKQLNLIAYEQEEENLLADVLNHAKSEVVNLFIGPEGGFSPFEIDLARQNSLVSVSLGKRILRAETAGIVGCSLIAQIYA